MTLEQHAGNYVDALGQHLSGSHNENPGLEMAVENVAWSLERVWDEMERIGRNISEREMTATVRYNGDLAAIDLDEPVEANGENYCPLDEFRDIVFISHHMNREGLEIAGEDGNGTIQAMITASEDLVNSYQMLEKQYDRLLSAELLARKYFDTGEVLEPYEVEPPLYSMLNNTEHQEKLNRLNSRIKEDGT